MPRTTFPLPLPHRSNKLHLSSFKVHLNSLTYDSIMKAALITAEGSGDGSTIYPWHKEWVLIYVHRSKKGKLHKSHYLMHVCAITCTCFFIFKTLPWSLRQGRLASLEARVFRDGIAYHLQGAESGRQYVTHDVPAQKSSLSGEARHLSWAES